MFNMIGCWPGTGSSFVALEIVGLKNTFIEVLSQTKRTVGSQDHDFSNIALLHT